ncbi:MAG TPA: hypothetical protein DDY77_02650 [Clostridiales bacterium]|nr:hypothetical protein [Clostridiales bacterium]
MSFKTYRQSEAAATPSRIYFGAKRRNISASAYINSHQNTKKQRKSLSPTLKKKRRKSLATLLFLSVSAKDFFVLRRFSHSKNSAFYAEFCTF